MIKVYQTVLRHSILMISKKTDKIALTIFLNQNTDMEITVGGLAINTIIRQAYNYYMEKKNYKSAYLILTTYKPELYNLNLKINKLN
ncbi:hypothetical protein G1K66_01295 [Tenacibaculum finnmarkense]|uniref:hypothetical protein n=1 Tax=Tenacibaculum finnmarkense TaxID=2781243 RepID=UPI001EFB5B6A|nr:hypothetical protein [Tenacibaculum finnmarkense]MCG8784412.1 hypothetical protein [Tenacibaculum finnmarkense]MCG8806801.1 hypothetical protein [Tenacibaculum finnmarkense]MCG8811896.1 hypothetical protein [Tenacibaculum finnmarkense]MCG8817041.1 hypothetical protein [Tenacibaculum finnmarkense]